MVAGTWASLTAAKLLIMWHCLKSAEMQQHTGQVHTSVHDRAREEQTLRRTCTQYQVAVPRHIMPQVSDH